MSGGVDNAPRNDAVVGEVGRPVGLCFFLPLFPPQAKRQELAKKGEKGG